MSVAPHDQVPGLRWRQITIACFWALVLLLAVRATFSVSASEASPWLIYGVTLIPLLAFCGVVHQSSKRGLAWLSFLLCIYFLQPVIDLMVGRHLWLNSGLVTVICGLFIGIMGVIRLYTPGKT